MASWLIGIGGALLLAELCCALYYSTRDGRWIPARRRILEDPNTGVSGVTEGRAERSYNDILFPHPYLGFVFHANPPRGWGNCNNVGLTGRDFPVERNPDAYTILVTGGSVAQQLGQLSPGGPYFLEEYLNEHFQPPEGRDRFIVLNGGAGAWKQPQQAILLLLYSDVIDAMVTLEGFNEHYFFLPDAQLNLEYPAQNFLTVNPVAAGGYRPLLGAWLGSVLRSWLGGHPVLGLSHAAVALYEWARRAIVRPLVDAVPGEERKTTLQSIFAQPPGWFTERRRRHNLARYRRYLISMSAIAERHGVEIAHFVQPVPGIGKRLTPAEEKIVGNLDYADTYRWLTDELLALSEVGVPIYGLLDLFSDCAGDIYEDHSHCIREPDGDSPGYRLMAQAMGEDVARAWGLTRRGEERVPPEGRPKRPAEGRSAEGPDDWARGFVPRERYERVAAALERLRLEGEQRADRAELLEQYADREQVLVNKLVEAGRVIELQQSQIQVLDELATRLEQSDAVARTTPEAASAPPPERST